MGGWIKIHRQIQDSWIWEDSKLLKWWLIILFHVNHEPKRFPVGDKIYVCNEGQSFRSLEQWGELFSCSKRAVLKFFDMLQKDGMVTKEIIGNGNRRRMLLTVNNWATFQELRTENDTEKYTRNDTENDTEKYTLTRSIENEENKENNKKNSKEFQKVAAAQAAALARSKIFYDSLTPFVPLYGKEMVRDFYNHWSEMNKSKTKMNFELQKTWDTKLRLVTWEKREKQYGRNNKPTAGANNNASAANKAASRRDLEAAADRILGEP